jgi:perosamine synthetase
VIPVNSPLLVGNEKKYVNECLDSGWISSEGPFVSRFEQEMASYVGRKYATACSSGTAALDLAVASLKLERDDEVIMPSMTIISCAQCLVNKGIKPILIDCDLFTYNMKVEDIEDKITKKTKAIMIVHIFGLTVDIDPILLLAKKYNLRIIEDAAEMLGQEYKGKKCGSFGDVSIFSFYPNKHVTTGEGGMLLSDEIEIDSVAKSYRNLCFSTDRFVHNELGYNYRMTNVQAAIGVAQLENINSAIQKKRWIGSLYNKFLENVDGIYRPVPKTAYCENIYWVYSVVLAEGVIDNAKDLMKSLGGLEIGTRPFFFPIHQQPVFKKMGFFSDIKLKNSEYLYQKGFYLPSGLALTEGEIFEVSKALIKCIHELQ